MTNFHDVKQTDGQVFANVLLLFNAAKDRIG